MVDLSVDPIDLSQVLYVLLLRRFSLVFLYLRLSAAIQQGLRSFVLASWLDFYRHLLGEGNVLVLLFLAGSALCWQNIDI